MGGAASAFAVAMSARVINQDMAHYLRRDGKKMSPILPVHFLLIDQPEVRFVDESGRLWGMSRILAAHKDTSQPAQFGIHKWDQFIERGLVTATPSRQEERDFLWNCLHNIA